MSYGTPNPFARSLPPFPGTVLTAGIIWIVFGGLIILNAVGVVLLGLVLVGRGPGAGEMATAIVLVSLIVAVFGAVFLMVGIQSIRGTARATLANGSGSIVFGLIAFAGALSLIGSNQVIQGILSFLSGSGLLAAGVLALVGRSDYRAWRQAAQS